MADTPPPSQDNRTAKLATPFGKDKLCLVRFEGHEAIGELFEFRVDAVSTQANIDFDPQLGQNCSVHFDVEENVTRDFSGVLTEARYVGRRFDLYAYRLVLRPWPWLLTLRAQCRIFMHKSIKQIIKEALGEGKYGPIDDSKVTGSYPEPEYTVQYRETDLNFALRLMEKYGIYFYFKFDDGDGASPSAHTLVLSDDTSFQSLPKVNSVALASYASSMHNKQFFRDWAKVQAMVAGEFEMNDYDYNKPPKDLLTHQTEPYPYDQGRSYVFDYPGGYDDKEFGQTLTKVRRDADRRGALSHASGYVPSLIPGYKFNRTSLDGDPLDGEYLIRHCTHFYGDEAYAARGVQSGAVPAYDGRYEFSDSSIPYRMPLRSRRPVIIGTQPAKVIRDEKNAAGEEIDVDKLGRIYVRFYWDIKAKEVLARRVRVSQIWAGKTRGALFTPRVGDEVVVAYEDGDPDRPIVVGSVYNGDNTVPMTLPDKKVKSGILTMSSKGGSGYNMLLFDDTKGDEHVKLRSEKDLMFKALNNEQRDILNSQTENIGQDETINVGFPGGSGNFTLNALQTVTINVGPKGSPLTQIKMDTSSITLNVGPSGTLAQIKMDASGVTISGTPISQLMVQPSGITTATPTLTFGIGPAVFTSQVTIPIANIGAGTVGPLPLI